MASLNGSNAAAKTDVAIACFTGNSGLTDYSISLARALQHHRAVTVITGQSIEPRFREFGFPVITPFRRSRWYPVDVVRFFVDVLRLRPRWLVFQAQLKVPLLEAWLVRLLRLAGIRCVLTIHDVLPHYPRAWSRREFAHFYKAFDKLVVHSEAAAEQVRALGVRSPMLVVPHGVYDLFVLKRPSQAEARARLGLPAGVPVVLFFGHLEQRKGLGVVLAAARRWAGRSDVHFLIAGKPSPASMDEALRAQFAECASWPNVSLFPERIAFEDVEQHFCAATAVALPYLEGTTSGVLKLALAFGLPAVATDVGDFAEELPPRAGVLVRTGPSLVDDFCAAVEAIVREPASFQQAMQGAADSRGWALVADRYAAFLST